MPHHPDMLIPALFAALALFLLLIERIEARRFA